MQLLELKPAFGLGATLRVHGGCVMLEDSAAEGIKIELDPARSIPTDGTILLGRDVDTLIETLTAWRATHPDPPQGPLLILYPIGTAGQRPQQKLHLQASASGIPTLITSGNVTLSPGDVTDIMAWLTEWKERRH